jgi:hypothetical protein
MAGSAPAGDHLDRAIPRSAGRSCLYPLKDGRQPADYGHDKRNNGNQLSHVKGPQQSSFSLLSSTAQDDYIYDDILV